MPGKAVPDAEIFADALMVNDAGRINQVMVYCPNLGAANIDPATWDHFNLRWDRWSYENGTRHHGTKKLVVQTRYAVPEMLPSSYSEVRDMAPSQLLYDDDHVHDMQAGKGPVMDLLRKKGLKLWRWHSLSHRMAAGRVIITGDPFWRVGYRFENERGPSASYIEQEGPRRWAYVQTVVQDWVRDSHYRTHLGLARGVRIGQVPGEKLPTNGLEFRARWSEERQRQAAAVMDEIDL